MIADVALPLPLFQTYSYRIPDVLADRILPGCRVKVPFQNRKRTGIVLACHEATDEPDRELKELVGLEEDTPVLDAEGLELVSELQRRYGASPGEAAATVAPPLLGTARSMANPLVSLAADWRRKVNRLRGDFSLAAQYLENRGTVRLQTLLQDLSMERSRALRWLKNGILQEISSDFALRIRQLRAEHPLEPDPAQAAAIEILNAALATGKFREFLLHGVTGSGKTEVYLRAMETALATGRSVLYLVPEIALVPQTMERLRKAASEEMACWHSRLRRVERREELRKLQSGHCRLLVGTRSAVFLPLPSIGLIVIDEEHDGSYAQSSDVNYDARDLARWRARRHGAVLVSGSATPSLRLYHRSEEGSVQRLELPSRIGGRSLPTVTTVDLLSDSQAGSVISRRLADETALQLEGGGQVLYFLNRKGYAPVILCRKCGQVVHCRDCAVTLTLHREKRSAICHLCGYSTPPPRLCPSCGGGMKFVGTGTERIAEEASRLFPGARVERFDADVLRDGEDLFRILRRIAEGGVDIVVGTQIFSKGHDFRGLTLVGVISADTSMSMPDYRAAERTFQMICQVIGRVGREEQPGRAVIQTFGGSHYALDAALRGNYRDFYDREIHYRREYKYPPFSRLVRFLVSGEEETRVEEAVRCIHRELSVSPLPDSRLLPPAPAPVSRVRLRTRHHVLLFLPPGEEFPAELPARRALWLKEPWLRGLTLKIEVDPEDVL